MFSTTFISQFLLFNALIANGTSAETNKPIQPAYNPMPECKPQVVHEFRHYPMPSKNATTLDFFIYRGEGRNLRNMFTDPTLLGIKLTDTTTFKIYLGENCSDVYAAYLRDEHVTDWHLEHEDWSKTFVSAFDSTVFGVATQEEYRILLFRMPGFLTRIVPFGCAFGLFMAAPIISGHFFGSPISFLTAVLESIALFVMCLTLAFLWIRVVVISLLLVVVIYFWIRCRRDPEFMKFNNPPNEIRTQPGWKIVFNAPFNEKRTCNVQVTNSSDHRLGWMCKITDRRRLGVEPWKGVLDPNESTLIAVSCDAFVYNQENATNNRVTIEWIQAPEGVEKKFCREWFQGEGKVRIKTLRIDYNR